jgi:hypothetical protein
MDISFLSNYFIVIVVGICLCLGYVIKESLSFIDNKYIPLIMAVVGVALNIWVAGDIDAEILLGGMFSGLASTGLYEAFRNLIKKEV